MSWKLSYQIESSLQLLYHVSKRFTVRNTLQGEFPSDEEKADLNIGNRILCSIPHRVCSQWGYKITQKDVQGYPLTGS